ncbi:MAG: hypothetical protein AAF597_07255 [Bacteroidota bacterium]
MGFGGVGAMMQSVKNNRALRRGRNHLFDRDVDLKTRRYIGSTPKPTAQVREKFRQQLAEEKRRDRNVLLVSIVIGLITCYFLYTEVLVSL